LAASLTTVEVRTVADQGWVGISNGQLRAKSNRIADLVALAPELIAAFPIGKKSVVTPIGL